MSIIHCMSWILIFRKLLFQCTILIQIYFHFSLSEFLRCQIESLMANIKLISAHSAHNDSTNTHLDYFETVLLFLDNRSLFEYYFRWVPALSSAVIHQISVQHWLIHFRNEIHLTSGNRRDIRILYYIFTTLKTEAFNVSTAIDFRSVQIQRLMRRMEPEFKELKNGYDIWWANSRRLFLIWIYYS